ncbi:MAG: MFS transporter [Ilumatobacteraceae bacterium]
MAPHATNPGRSRSARLAIGAVFFANGVTFASWAPRLPEIQDRLDVSNAALGIALVGTGVGGLSASLMSGRLVDRLGSRTMTVATTTLLSIALPLMGVAPTAVALFASLVVLGALDGLTDVAMNAQAIELQRRLGSSILSRFHAVWSAGSLTGGVLASRAAEVGLDLRLQLVITAAVLIGLTTIASRALLTSAHRVPHSTSAPDRAWTRAILVRLLLIGMVVALVESPPVEWSALLMRDRFDINAGAAGLGFVAVAGGMLVGRLVGDHVTDRCGPELTRRGSAALAAVGVIVATLAPHPVLAGIGLVIAGLGIAALFPLLFRAASDLTHGSHSGMAAFSSGARLGFLIASPAVGLLAGGTSIAVAVLVVSGGAAVAVAASRLPASAAQELAVDQS